MACIGIDVKMADKECADFEHVLGNTTLSLFGRMETQPFF